jgi:ribosome biogenesis SPOUT family RNA methylase Rps3
MQNRKQSQKQIYIIEHLEPKLFDWCIFEYEHISEIVGKENLWFTNIKDKKDARKLEKFGKIFFQSVKEMKELNNSRTCVLDPEIDTTLNPKECNSFDYFIFGGILGDYPPRKRTKEELTKFLRNIEVRNIGKEQMSTDNAVYTVFQIANGKGFKDLKFQDGVSVKINNFESVDLPYRYNLLIENGRKKIFMSPKVVEYLKKKKGF